MKMSAPALGIEVDVRWPHGATEEYKAMIEAAGRGGAKYWRRLDISVKMDRCKFGDTKLDNCLCGDFDGSTAGEGEASQLEKCRVPGPPAPPVPPIPKCTGADQAANTKKCAGTGCFLGDCVEDICMTKDDKFADDYKNDFKTGLCGAIPWQCPAASSNACALEMFTKRQNDFPFRNWEVPCLQVQP